MVSRGEEKRRMKGGKYLKKENMWSGKEKNGKGKTGKYLEKENLLMDGSTEH